MTLEVRAIRESEWEECLDLWQAVFGDPRAYFARYFAGDADYQPEYTRCAFVNRRMVSAVQICRRVVACGDFTLTMGGIANVATLEPYRGRGYNTACLRDALRVMEADAMDFSLLFTGRHGFYARLGWESVSLPCLAGEIRPDFRPQGGMTVRPYAAGDEDAVRAVYAEYNRTRPITVRRSAPYWRDWIGWDGGRSPGEAWVAMQEGQIVGYVLYRVRAPQDRPGSLQALEIGARAEGGAAAIMALLEDAASAGLARGIRRMEWSLPVTPAIHAAAARLFGSVEEHRRTGGMARYLRGGSLLHGLLPELTAWWLSAGAPPGGMTFRLPGEMVRLEAYPGGLRLIEVKDTGQDSLSQSDLYALLTGVGLPPERLDPADAFARALFPPFDAWYWALDGF